MTVTDNRCLYCLSPCGKNTYCCSDHQRRGYAHVRAVREGRKRAIARALRKTRVGGLSVYVPQRGQRNGQEAPQGLARIIPGSGGGS